VTAPIVLIPENPMPEGGEAFWLDMDDGARLRYLAWKDNAAPRGTVFLFGGRTEFAEKYFEVIGELRARGFAVVTLDWRGQGLSTRMLPDARKGHIDDFATFDRDLARFMGEVAPSFPKPWTALAHSMGGQILLRALHDRPEWFSRAVFSAPMLGLNFAKWMERGVRATINLMHLLGKDDLYVPGGTPKANDEIPFEQNILTHDERRYGVLQALTRTEPKLGLGAATVGWLHAAFRAMDEAASPAFLASVKVPVLICEAAGDKLVSSVALAHAAAHLPQSTLVIVPGSGHEILIERDAARAVFWKAFDEFMAQ
jgi:lysophospholipase|tara:strand:+ start:988 stop:1926 length:939 start_codon:yes stop_codon:yes gene_type:complete